MSEPAQLEKPKLRGVSHQYAFFVSLAAGSILVGAAETERGEMAAIIYCLSLSALLGTSALYHRKSWSPTRLAWMRRLDHSMIFVLIAGSYTPFALLVLVKPLASVMLVLMWTASLGGVALKFLWDEMPDWLSAFCYVAVAWVGSVTFPEIVDGIGWLGTGLLVLGGVLYTAGAAIFALKRPDPLPRVFGYHEVFHVLVLVAAGLHFAAIALYVVPT